LSLSLFCPSSPASVLVEAGSVVLVEDELKV
jgi:hypothetical protein